MSCRAETGLGVLAFVVAKAQLSVTRPFSNVFSQHDLLSCRQGFLSSGSRDVEEDQHLVLQESRKVSVDVDPHEHQFTSNCGSAEPGPLTTIQPNLSGSELEVFPNALDDVE